MSLTTVQKITYYSWDEIPMSDTVIDQVNKLGRYQPEHLTFRDIKGQLIGEVKLTGVDEEPTETPHKIEAVEEADLDQSEAVNE